MDAKMETLIKAQRVGPRLYHCRCDLHLKHQLPEGYADVASTGSAHAKAVFSTIVNDEKVLCALLQILPCDESSDYSMSSNSTAALRQANQQARVEPTNNSKNALNGIQQNGFRGRSPPRGGHSTPKTRQWVTAANVQAPVRPSSPPANRASAKASRTQQPTKN